ncbi:MAG: hypothetical protein ACFFCS_11400 [Candidatus Hodarchaeota archaeon]
MTLLACVSLDIKQRSIDEVWQNLQTSLAPADNIEPVAMGIIFETYDIMVFLSCGDIDKLTYYIINRMRSIKGVTETTVFFINEMNIIEHENLDIVEPGLDGLLLIDAECGKDVYVYEKIQEHIGPEKEKTCTKFISYCLHSQNLDLLVGFKGFNLYYLDQMFSKIRLIDGVIDILVLMFSRFTTLMEMEDIEKRFPWFV